MATKYQTELALKVLLIELNYSGQDLYKLIDDAILRMQQEKIFVKEDSHQERGGAEDVLFTNVEVIAGKRPDVTQGNIENF
ncbi:hypothetical protein [Citrobacter freundii]|uniref:hypothetical protein n=1 Tax=Citrobacter freundii TaxID=546 RepID=UPI000EF19D4B|nr:hypothetical protein [Citrobacter freundii]AYL49762.1 hypothetical protein CUC46_14330 [Citrobacter freundii]